jgi:hypothetical protein
MDYFFRGLLTASGNDLSFGFGNGSDEAMDGTFTMYYDDASDTRRPVPGAQWTRALEPHAFVEELRLSAPSSPLPKEPGKYMLVFRGALGSEREAVVGRQVFIEPMLVVRLVKRRDGTPHREAAVQAIDVQNGAVLSSDVTDQDGRVQLAWKPGRTVLFIPAVNLFPMYWAGASAFSSSIEGGRTVQTTDLDSQRQVTIPIPVILAAWPERIEACTEKPLFTHQPHGVFQQSTSLGGGLADFVSIQYGVNLITFIRDDNGQETVLCGADTPSGCVDPRTGFVAEDVNRVGQVVGRLVRDVSARHSRHVIHESGGEFIDPPVCDTEYSEVEVVPVTVAEE